MLKATRQLIIDKLESQFTYYTMNSWNKTRSYARNVKIQHIHIPEDIVSHAYDLVSKEWFYDCLKYSIINQFETRNNDSFTIGFNGRSSGYAVLYKMSYKVLDYCTRCDRCGTPTWYEDGVKCRKCKTGTLRQLKKPMRQKVVGGGVMVDDFNDVEGEVLLNTLLTLVDFNNTVDDMIELTKSLAKQVKDGEIDVETGNEPDLDESEIAIRKPDINQLSLF